MGGGMTAFFQATSGSIKIRWMQALGFAAFGMVLGQATLYHRAAPFAWGLIILCWVYNRSLFLPALAGAVIGIGMGAGWAPASLMVVFALTIPTLGRRSVQRWLMPILGGIGGAAIFAVGLPHTMAGGLLTLLSAILGGGSVWAGRRVWEWLTESDTRKEPVSTAVGLYCFFALLAGLLAMHVGWWIPGLTLGALVMLLAAAVGGPAGGALAGATLGITLALRGGAMPGSVGILAVAGFGAGFMARRHWRLGSLGMMVTMALYAVFLHSPPILSELTLSASVGGAVFVGLPDVGYDILQAWAQAVSGSPQPDPVPERMAKMAHVLEEIARVFTLSDGDRTPEPNRVQQVVGQVCQRCSLYRHCWESEFYRSYRGVQDLVLKAGEGKVGPQQMEAQLARRCIKPDQLTEAVNMTEERGRQVERYRQQMADTRRLVESQLRGLSSLLVDMAEDLNRPLLKPKGRRRRLGLTVGIAKRPRAGGGVSGDSHLIQELGSGRVVIGVSDGMGVGPDAAFESGTTVALLEELLKAGLSSTMAIKVVNTALLLRSPEERFATLDLALLDLSRREAELVKVAAAPTFFRRNDTVSTIRAESLPVGILKDVQVEPMYHKIESGDVLVMVSDGALGPPDVEGEERLQGYLRHLPLDRAEIMAETLLSLMLGQAEDGRDDALVIVIRVSDKKMTSPVKLGEQVVGEWHRVTPNQTHRHVPG